MVKKHLLLLLMAGCASSAADAHHIRIRYGHSANATVVSLDLPPGEQVEQRVRRCPQREVKPSDWQRSLEAEGYVVDVGRIVNFAFGLRFRRAQDGVYGDIFVEAVPEPGKFCEHMIVRLQRARVAGSPDPWKTKFELSTLNVPDSYFVADSMYPVGY